MKRMSFAGVAVGLGLVALGLAAAEDRPNILFLTAEDTSAASIGCYNLGDANTSTPTLDALAKRGILFERCYAMSPVCAPSRFTMVTGVDPVTCGSAHHMRGAGVWPRVTKGMPAYLRDAGYYTTNNEKQDYNVSGLNVPACWNESSNKASWTNRPSPEASFYSVFNFFDTHESCVHGTPYSPPEITSKVRVPGYMPDTIEIRGALAWQAKKTTDMDTWVAQMLAKLEADGLADNTIIVFSSDHGNLSVRSKRFLNDTGTRIPLIAYFPPKWQHLAPAAPGTRITTPVSQEDFGPTFLALAGLPQPEHTLGIPFAGKDIKNVTPRKYAFSSRNRMDDRYDMSRSAHDGRWLYIRNFYTDIPYIENIEYMFHAGGWKAWRREAEKGTLLPDSARFWLGHKPTEELYDCHADPDNLVNLASDPACAEKFAELRAALREHIVRYYDNGLLPEGCGLEGYLACREPGAWDVSKTLDMAWLASEADPKNLEAFVKGAEDPSVPVRWWAATGLRLLGKKAASAKPVLVKMLEDPSEHIRVEAASALVKQGEFGLGLPALVKGIASANAPCALQAANALYRTGKAAAPALEEIRQARESITANESWFTVPGCVPIVLRQTLAVLDGKAQLLPSEARAADVNAP